VVEDIAEDYPETFAPITMHVNDDSYSTAWGQGRIDSFYGQSGFTPTFIVDGVWIASASEYRFYVEQQLASPTDMTIDMSANQVASSTWDVTARVCKEGSGSRQVRVYIAQTLDQYPSPPDYSTNVLRQDVPTQDITVSGGGCQDVTAQVTLDSISMSNLSNVVFVAWAQAPSNTGPAEVYQAGLMRYPFPAGSQLTTIDIAPVDPEVEVGGEVVFTATGKDQFGDPYPLSDPSWSLAGSGTGDGTFNPASGSATTTFTATAAGSREVRCQDQGVTGTATVTITDSPRLVSIEIDPESATVGVGEQVEFSAVGVDQFGEPYNLTVPTWWLTGETCGTVDPTRGTSTTFTAEQPGVCQLSCEEEGVTGTADIEVTGDDPVLTSIVIDPASVEVDVDGQVSFTAAGKDQYGEDFALTDPTWDVSGDGDGTFDPGAGTTTVFTATYPGTCVVSCTQGEVTGTADVGILGDDPQLEAIAISPASAQLRIGDEIEFVATGTDQYGRSWELEDPAWRTEGDGDGTFDPADGSATTTFTATAEGTTQVICSEDGIEGTATVEIASRTLPPPRKGSKRVIPD
jgi:plastocyanin